MNVSYKCDLQQFYANLKNRDTLRPILISIMLLNVALHRAKQTVQALVGCLPKGSTPINTRQGTLDLVLTLKS